MATFCPRSKLVLSKLIGFVCLVCTNRVSNKVNVLNPANQRGEGQYRETVVSQGISFLMTFYIEQQRHSYLIQYGKASSVQYFRLPLCNLNLRVSVFEKRKGTFGKNASYIENSLIVIVLHDCNSVLIQTVIVFFHR